MISNETKQTIDTQGEGIVLAGSFKITDATQARIMMSLSDKIYSKKLLAIIREYHTNAKDAMIQAGKPVNEIITTFPTLEASVLKIRDFGLGLTEDEIINIYCVFGESTKRNSNDYNGLLGYGSKSGFAVSDSFTVTSWVNGEKSIYQCIKGDTTKLHACMLLSRSQSDEPTGIEVSIPILTEDVWELHNEAGNFFKYWDVLPQFFNLEEQANEIITKFQTTAPTLQGENWSVRPKQSGTATGVAYMGSVAYAINWNLMNDKMALTSQTRVLFDLLQCNDVVLNFKMGEVQFTDSRESLEYSALTVESLKTRITEIFNKIKVSIQSKFETATSIWDAKIVYNSIFGTSFDSDDKDSADTTEKIRILDGNMTKLEETFRGAFTWNSIPLDGAKFYKINRFDNMDVTKIQSNECDPAFPVMVSYKRNGQRLKTKRCVSAKANSILASTRTLIIINDTGRKSGIAVAARYFLFEDESKYNNIHILNFTSDSLKDLFYKEYHFDTVPVIILSTVLETAKSWYAANKKTGYGSGSGTGEVYVKALEYLDLSGDGASLEESDVRFKDIDEDVYFIRTATGRRSRNRLVINGSYQYKGDVADAIKRINDSLDLGIEKVYIVTNQIANAKWFSKAVNEGKWIPVMKFLEDNAKPDVQSLINNTIDNDLVEIELAKSLLNQFGEFHILTNLFNTILSISVSEDAAEEIEAYNKLGLWYKLASGVIPNINLDAMQKEITKIYPFIDWNGLYRNHENLNRSGFIRYINAMDLYNQLNPVADDVAVEESEAVPA